jgi:hypothetical protein
LVELMGRYSKMNSQAVKLRELLAQGSDQVVSRPRKIKQLQTRLSTDRLEAFAEAYQAGTTIPDLIKEFKISRSAVFGIVKRLGLPGRRPTLRPTDIDEACRLYLDGSSLTDISGGLSVAPNTIRRVLLERGIVLRGPQRRNSA